MHKLFTFGNNQLDHSMPEASRETFQCGRKKRGSYCNWHFGFTSPDNIVLIPGNQNFYFTFPTLLTYVAKTNISGTCSLLNKVNISPYDLTYFYQQPGTNFKTFT